MIPLVFFPTILPQGGGGVPGFTDMVDGFIIPEFFNSNFSNGEFVFALTDTEKKVTAKHGTIGTGTTATIENTEDNADYKPPSGKTSRVVVRLRTGSAFSGSVDIRASDTVDTADGTILQTWSAVASSILWTSKIVTIPAGKFLTITNQAGGGSLGDIFAWIAEEK